MHICQIYCIKLAPELRNDFAYAIIPFADNQYRFGIIRKLIQFSFRNQKSRIINRVPNIAF